MQANQLCGLLYEFGTELPPWRSAGLARIPEELAKLETVLPAMVIDSVLDQRARLQALDKDIAEIERRLAAWKKDDVASRRLTDIPGVGLLTATAALATIGEARACRSGRKFAAFGGLVPRQAGTDGRVRLWGVSTRGDVYLRTLLIQGVRSVITHGKQLDAWLTRLLARRPFNAAVVALANKTARAIWALLAHERTYRKDYAAQAA